MSRLTKIKRALSGPYFFSFIFIIVGYIIINGIVNKTAANGFAVLTTYRTSFLVPYIALQILVATLVALTLNLVIIKWKELKELREMRKTTVKTSTLGAVGLFTGLLGGACPGCFVGLFPAVAGLFGITASLGVLPLYGLELQILSAILLAGAVFLLTRNAACKITKMCPND